MLSDVLLVHGEKAEVHDGQVEVCGFARGHVRLDVLAVAQSQVIEIGRDGSAGRIGGKSGHVHGVRGAGPLVNAVAALHGRGIKGLSIAGVVLGALNPVAGEVGQVLK